MKLSEVENMARLRTEENRAGSNNVGRHEDILDETLIFDIFGHLTLSAPGGGGGICPWLGISVIPQIPRNLVPWRFLTFRHL